MRLQSCRRWLTGVWWTGGGLLMLLMLLAGINGQAFAKPVDGLDWLLPHIVPTMALTGAVAFLGKTPPAAGAARSDLPFLFRLAMGASLFYLAMVAVLILTSSPGPDTAAGPATIIAVLAGWNSVLAVVQGLVASAIGVFFTRE